MTSGYRENKVCRVIVNSLLPYSYNSDLNQLTSLCQKFAYGSKSLLSSIVQRGVTIQSNFTKISTISCQNSNHLKVPIQSCPMKKTNQLVKFPYKWWVYSWQEMTVWYHSYELYTVLILSVKYGVSGCHASMMCFSQLC